MPDIDIYTFNAEVVELKTLITKYGLKRKLRKKDFFIQENYLSNEIAFVKEGSFKSWKRTKKGKERIVFFIFENEIIGNYLPCRNRSSALLNIQAMEDSILYVIKMDEHIPFFEKRVMENTYVLKLVEVLAFQYLQKIVSLSCSTPEELYFQLIENVPDIFYRVNLKDIAAYIGITPEALSRMRTSFLKKNSTNVTKQKCNKTENS